MLKYLGGHATATMALGVFVGLALQPLAAVSRPLLFPAVWALLALSMMRLDGKALAAVLRRPGRLGAVLAWNLAATPVLVWMLVSPLPLPDGVAAAVIMTAASSPLMSTPAIGLILGLDAALIMAVLVAATVLIPLSLPLVILALLGLDLETGLPDLMARLGGLVGSAALAAYAARRLIGRARIEEARVALDGAAVLLLVLFAIPLMDGLTARFISEPGRMLTMIAVSFAVYIGLLAAGAVVFGVLWCDRRAALSAGLTSGCRNLAILIAVLPDGIDPVIITYFALAQFPIYIMPSVLRPVLARTGGDTCVDGAPAPSQVTEE